MDGMAGSLTYLLGTAEKERYHECDIKGLTYKFPPWQCSDMIPEAIEMLCARETDARR